MASLRASGSPSGRSNNVSKSIGGRVLRKHTKSRNGCIQCKLRRVKCDELTPCSSCLHRNEKCERANSRTKDCRGACKMYRSVQWSRDMFLMSHYTSNTALTFIADDPRMGNTWSKSVPMLAMECPSLMNGILSLAALHLSYLHPDDSAMWSQSALKYQNTALALFRSTLSNLNESNIHQTMALSTILSVSSMACSRPGTFCYSCDSVEVADVIEPMMHINGIFNVMKTGRKWFASGPLGLLRGMVVSAPGYLSKSTEEQFDRLRDAIISWTHVESTQNCLLETLKSLQYTFRSVSALPRDHKLHIRVVWEWAAFISPEYFSLLQGSHPAALVIFAHFAILTSACNQSWYLSGYSRRSLDAVRAAIPESWKEYLDWPEKQLDKSLSDILDTGDRITEIQEEKSAYLETNIAVIDRVLKAQNQKSPF